MWAPRIDVTPRDDERAIRAIPLADGAIVEQAKASFTNGVLGITIPAPPEHVNRGRRLEISEGSGQSK